ncbi:hypothetical protein PCE1_000715 [Barthelona sp. PCE]
MSSLRQSSTALPSFSYGTSEITQPTTMSSFMRKVKEPTSIASKNSSSEMSEVHRLRMKYLNLEPRNPEPIVPFSQMSREETQKKTVKKRPKYSTRSSYWTNVRLHSQLMMEFSELKNENEKLEVSLKQKKNTYENRTKAFSNEIRSLLDECQEALQDKKQHTKESSDMNFSQFQKNLDEGLKNFLKQSAISSKKQKSLIHSTFNLRKNLKLQSFNFDQNEQSNEEQILNMNEGNLLKENKLLRDQIQIVQTKNDGLLDKNKQLKLNLGEKCLVMGSKKSTLQELNQKKIILKQYQAILKAKLLAQRKPTKVFSRKLRTAGSKVKEEAVEDNLETISDVEILRLRRLLNVERANVRRVRSQLVKLKKNRHQLSDLLISYIGNLRIDSREERLNVLQEALSDPNITELLFNKY